MLWKNLKIASVDVETTGLDDEEDRIIEVGIVHFKDGDKIGEYNQLINPEMEIPEKSTEITGITDKMVSDKPTFKEVAEEVHEELSKSDAILAYNFDFDKGFLENELNRFGYEWPDRYELDPLVFAREIFREKNSRKLTSVAEYLDIDLDNAHRAKHDAEASGKVIYEVEGRLPEKIDVLVDLQNQWEIAQDRSRSGGSSDIIDDDSNIELGNGYVYSNENDYLRYLVYSVPDVGD